MNYDDGLTLFEGRMIRYLSKRGCSRESALEAASLVSKALGIEGASPAEVARLEMLVVQTLAIGHFERADAADLVRSLLGHVVARSLNEPRHRLLELMHGGHVTPWRFVEAIVAERCWIEARSKGCNCCGCGRPESTAADSGHGGDRITIPGGRYEVVINGDHMTFRRKDGSAT